MTFDKMAETMMSASEVDAYRNQLVDHWCQEFAQLAGQFNTTMRRHPEQSWRLVVNLGRRVKVHSPKARQEAWIKFLQPFGFTGEATGEYKRATVLKWYKPRVPEEEKEKERQKEKEKVQEPLPVPDSNDDIHTFIAKGDRNQALAPWQFAAFRPGSRLNVKDTVNHWYPATVLDCDAMRVLVHYDGTITSKFDEWISRQSERLACYNPRGWTPHRSYQ